MKKIPTLFKRDPANKAAVLPEVNPACQWVIDGEGIATRKYDGTCVKLDDAGKWWARREVKPGKAFPDGYVTEQFDEATGKTVGWEPAEQSSYAKLIVEVNEGCERWPGTFELCGPKVNGNPEGYDYHVLVPHDWAMEIIDAPRDFGGLREFFADFPHEGIVWHHEDGRMAKLKVRDFPKEN